MIQVWILVSDMLFLLSLYPTISESENYMDGYKSFDFFMSESKFYGSFGNFTVQK